uniref:DUF438 domain-containing protein n=1 Tax=Ignisphaera aggregans TaxID=334771 RepID=A0A7C4FGI7_9CREN
MSRKIELVKELLKAVHRGVSVEELKKRYSDALSQISPVEIPLIEQQLIKEGIGVEDILKLCDLHVELFRDFLKSHELRGVPSGHPADLFMKENEWVLKQAEALALYASALASAVDEGARKSYFEAVKNVLTELKKVRLHYRKLQMLVFPYLERRGLVAVPRVLWGREDQVIVKTRQLLEVMSRVSTVDDASAKLVSEKALEIAREVSEIVFRENKILYPAVYALFSEGEWVAISEIASEMGWLANVGEVEWKPSAKPVLPYEIDGQVSPQQIEVLPQEFKSVALARGVEPDNYSVKRGGDIELSTGFLTPAEVDSIFRSLPLELTYADKNDRVRFFSESKLGRGFARARTILGRRIEYCHPPRLEKIVRQTVDELKQGKASYIEFWTKLGEAIVRVLIVPVKGVDGEYLGTLEIAEDMTEIVNKPEEIRKKIVVL